MFGLGCPNCEGAPGGGFHDIKQQSICERESKVIARNVVNLMIKSAQPIICLSSYPVLGNIYKCNEQFENKRKVKTRKGIFNIKIFTCIN